MYILKYVLEYVPAQRMEIKIHESNGQKIAEVISDAIVISGVQDALDIMVKPGLSGSRKIMIKKENLAPDFFDLKTGLAGEILQKFVNYQIQLAIIGDFENIASKSLQAFITESNRGRHIFFVRDNDLAIKFLSSN